MKIKKGDTVRVTVGKDAGREGKVVRTFAKAHKIVIENVNMYKKHVKKNEQMPQGGVVDLPRALPVSNVALVCPKTKKTTRVGFKIEKNKKVRFAKVSGVTI